ncbi:hypothetical protein LO771_09000 [Streptacidiphilus sp. ASG 303]|uniref:hypothetical protein n=1 Tax=Streptacidiphilus sp. ASG 303 TaxID=2896847 RepID=UPI001E373925|nr:hypothetical protein [Streptacidiphilus sp. ASG 303]MCD0482535.1 hypothetical protein [Streptacidiphilus sp. ASG 303]
MSTGATIALIVVAVVVVAALAALTLRPRMRRRRLERQFGPEYHRAVAEHGTPEKAQEDLEERLRLRRDLDVRPLSSEARERYRADWAGLQEEFVDAPGQALVDADELIGRVMRDRGYPADERDEALAALSVDHARTLQSYRSAHAVARKAQEGSATTEEMREAVVRARELFAELVEAGSGTPRPTTSH